MNTENLIKVIEESKDLSPREFVMKMEKELDKFLPVPDHTKINIAEALGINHDELPEGVEIDESKNFSETVCKISDSGMTKRELSYALLSAIVETVIKKDPIETLILGMLSKRREMQA